VNQAIGRRFRPVLIEPKTDGLPRHLSGVLYLAHPDPVLYSQPPTLAPATVLQAAQRISPFAGDKRITARVDAKAAQLWAPPIYAFDRPVKASGTLSRVFAKANDTVEPGVPLALHPAVAVQ